ncbi:MMPL family transporter [Nocardioides pacificus]
MTKTRQHAERSLAGRIADAVTGFITGRRTAAIVALVPILAAVAMLGFLGEGERDAASTDSLPRDADSTLATELRDQLPEEDSSVAIVLWTAKEGELSAGALEELTSTAGELLGAAGGAEGAGEGTPGGGGAPDGAEGAPEGAPAGGPEGGQQGPPVTPSEDGTAALLVVPVDSSTASDTADIVGDLRDKVDEALPEGVEGQVTGPAAVQADLAAVFDGANFRLLTVTASVVALLLVITYRSPVLWLIPLTIVGIADRLAAILATQVMAALDVKWDESTVGILSVLVFGAGTNYALLLISRYRDELSSHHSRNAAMAIALRRTAEAVLASASTVVIGVLTLLLSVTPTTRGLGLACAVGIVVAAVFVLVVLPATLVLFGRWVFWPRVPHEGDAALVESNTSLWRRVGDQVARRPLAFVGVTLALLAVMAVGLFRIEIGLGTADQFLDEPEAISASKRLAESFPAGTSQPTQVLTRADGQEVLDAATSADGVASARLSTEGAGITQIDVVLDADPSSAEARDAVGSLRDALASYDETYVGGPEAESLDEREAAGRDRLVILPLILGLVLLALFALLRSFVAPLLLVATVLGTYAASLGVSWWLFTQVFGFAALDVSTPLFAFLFLVALGVDYNIFLVTRAREEAAEHGTRQGMLRALTATGGVITSAGILLAAVFAVLGVLPLVVLAQLGVVICIGVLLDTLLVRTVLVPALAVALGDRFWWPRKVDTRDAAKEDQPAPVPA